MSLPLCLCFCSVLTVWRFEESLLISAVGSRIRIYWEKNKKISLEYLEPTGRENVKHPEPSSTAQALAWCHYPSHMGRLALENSPLE